MRQRMTRYFFDVTEQTGVRYDYSGRTLPSLDHARELAELIAIDLGCRESEKVPGTFVLVRDAGGQQLITVEVQPLTSLTA
jgi:Domain of unknown function (DUF6894)